MSVYGEYSMRESLEINTAQDKVNCCIYHDTCSLPSPSAEFSVHTSTGGALNGILYLALLLS